MSEQPRPEKLWIWGDESDGVALGYTVDTFGSKREEPTLFCYTEGQTSHTPLNLEQLARIIIWSKKALAEVANRP